ncbi:MAG: SDR family oxidoreductase [Bacteroidota bacterium]
MNDLKIKHSKVLVTGGAGFIGSNIIESLLNQDNYIVCLDNFSTGYIENVKIFFENSNFLLIEGDIRDIEICRNAVKGVDYVLHQAALGSVPRSIDDPKSTNDVNIGGFINMLIAAKDEKVKRFVYAASSSTYGDNADLPKVEHEIGNPLSPYAITKYVNELYAGMFTKLYDIETVGLRYFNVFGPKQDKNGAYAAVIPKFIDSLLNKKSPVINGDGSNTRDFTYIENVIIANQQAALIENKNAIGEVFNIACNKNITLNKLFDILKIEISQFLPEVSGIKPINKEARKGDVLHSLASVEKAGSFLNYQPVIHVEEGLKKTVKWFIEHSK